LLRMCCANRCLNVFIYGWEGLRVSSATIIVRRGFVQAIVSEKLTN